MVAVSEFLTQEVNDECKNEIQAMVDAGDQAGLESRLGSRLAFGTAGLRGPMRGGYNGMNDLVMIQTTQGLASYLMEQFGEQEVKDRGVIIGYDHRRKGSLSSLTFARYCAAVFLNLGIKVYCLEGLVPTPFVPFGVTKLNCVAGLMITASHNPKEDNGYKVYWSNGAQIIPPHDSGISKHINLNLNPAIAYDASDSFVLSHERSQDVTATISDAYMKAIVAGSAGADNNDAAAVKIAYTAMHGIGGKWMERAFSECNLNSLSCVTSQFDPDPDFPTVVFPNPEEKGALDAAMAYANEQGCDLILANDPDADRLAVAEKNPGGAGSGWTVFSGNQIGQLLGHWQIKKWKESGENAADAVVLTTVVSSRMLQAIAVKEGAGYTDTLTGFKWIGNKAIELAGQGKRVLLTYEEALGYCCGDILFDKDGIHAAVVFAAMAGYYRNQYQQSISQVMETLYLKYGRFVSYNSYIFCHDAALTDRIFGRIRTGGDGGTYWEVVAGVQVARIVDVTTGYDSGADSGKAELPTTPESHMIMFTFANGVTITLRTSGTEPKIKFYTELAGDDGQEASAVKDSLVGFVDEAVEELLQPTLHQLQRAS